jgi:hypothetical protein
MLRIRREKTKESQRKKREAMEGVAQETREQLQQQQQQQQQQQPSAAASSVTAVPRPRSPSRASFSQSQSAASASLSSAPHAVGGAAASSSGSGPAGQQMPLSNEERYSVYRQWLEEKKAMKGPAGGVPTGGGADLHHKLLQEENNQRSGWRACCPAWCFK